MMSAQDYRDRADALIDAADCSASLHLILELETKAREWRNLAVVADWQDAIVAALTAAGEQVEAQPPFGPGP